MIRLDEENRVVNYLNQDDVNRQLLKNLSDGSKEAAAAASSALEAAASASAAASSAQQAMSGTPEGYSNLVDSIAETFSTSQAYSAGDYVLYNSQLYVFTADHAAGAWTGSDAEAVTVGEEITDLKDALDESEALLSLKYDYAASAQADGYNSAIVFDDWEMGTLLNGNNLARTYAIRTANKRSFESDTPIVIVKHDTRYQWFFCTYSSDGTYETTSSNIGNIRYVFTPDTTKQYRFVIRLVDSSGIASVTDGVNAYHFYNSTDIYLPDLAHIRAKVSFNGNNVPYFYKTSSVAIGIVFKNGSIMYAKAGSNTYAHTFTSDTTFIVQNPNVLVWDAENNEVKIVADNATRNYIVLCKYAYGVFYYGELLPFYIMQQKALTTYNYPPYYDVNNYMDDKISVIETHEKEIGPYGDQFIFVTDTHWSNNRKNSPALVRTIINATQINKVFHGGDVPNAYQTAADMYAAIRGDVSAWRYAAGNFLYRLLGNHDIHTTDNTDTSNPIYTELTSDEVYGLLLKEQENRVQYNGDNLPGGYFYIDNQVQKIRYVCVNNFETPNTPSMSNAQITWIANKLLELETGWNAVIIGHCSIIADQEPNYAAYTDLLGIISAAQNKTSFTTSYNQTFDFSNSDFYIVGYFCGHRHRDNITTYNNVVYCLTTCDALYQDDGYNRAANTINEQAFDIVQINTENKTVYLTRIGAGSNRSFTYI